MTTTTKTPDLFRTRFHRDGTVTLWNVFVQSWERYHAGDVSDDLLATLGERTRRRITRMINRK